MATAADAELVIIDGLTRNLDDAPADNECKLNGHQALPFVSGKPSRRASCSLSITTTSFRFALLM